MGNTQQWMVFLNGKIPPRNGKNDWRKAYDETESPNLDEQKESKEWFFLLVIMGNPVGFSVCAWGFYHRSPGCPRLCLNVLPHDLPSPKVVAFLFTTAAVVCPSCPVFVEVNTMKTVPI